MRGLGAILTGISVVAVAVALWGMLVLVGGFAAEDVINAQPRVADAGLQWAPGDLERPTMLATVLVTNPGRRVVGLENIDLAVQINGETITSLTEVRDPELGARDAARIEGLVPFDGSAVLRWWRSHIAAGEVTEEVTLGDVGIRVGVSRAVLPVDIRSTWETSIAEGLERALPNCPPVGRFPCISSADVSWQPAAENGTALQISVLLYNANNATSIVEQIDIDIFLRERVWGGESIEGPLRVPPRGTTNITLVPILADDVLLRSWHRHVDECEGSAMRANLRMVQDRFDIPFEDSKEILLPPLQTYLGC